MTTHCQPAVNIISVGETDTLIPIPLLQFEEFAAELAAPKMWPVTPREVDILIDLGADLTRRERFAEQYAEKRERMRVEAGVDLLAGIDDDDPWLDGEVDHVEGGLAGSPWNVR